MLPTRSLTASRPGPGVPAHVVPGPAGHGVALYARQLAAEVGATVVEDERDVPADAGACHLHVTDRMWGASPEQAAARVVALCALRPTTLTLHDLPQPHDGRTLHPRRRRAYADMARAAAGIVVSSHHERRLLATVLGPSTHEVTVEVVPLPCVRPAGPAPLPAVRTPHADGRRTLGLAGWFYPGKGHLPALGAAAAAQRLGHVVDVLVLGRPAAGHEADAAALVERARRIGVRLEVTGWLDDADLHAALRAVDVPFAGHRNVSASGSVNSWLAAGRRPLVRRGPYFEEMARLRPGTLRLTDIGSLAGAVADALDDPGSTWLEPGVGLGHDLADAAADYRGFWERVLAPDRERVA